MTSANVPSSPTGKPQDEVTADGKPLAELWCVVAVIRGDHVLLVQRPDRGDCVLPRGRPHNHESIRSCGRRATREETGLDIYPNRCGLVLEVNDPITRRRAFELVLVADDVDGSARLGGELGRRPVWVRIDDLRSLTLRPPITGYLLDLASEAVER